MKSILIGLLFISSTAWCQPSIPDREDTLVYCLPIEKARLALQDAARLRIVSAERDTLLSRVNILESEKMASYHSFTNLIKTEQEKFETQKEITSDFVRLADGWKEEATYYQKRYKKQRRQKGLLTAVTVGLIGLIIVK